MYGTEEALILDCEGAQLLGILNRPPRDKPISRLAIVIVVGGPQYRAGSHRLFVQLARRLARGGFHVLRFDYRGMGDSEGHTRQFEHVTADIGAAIQALTTSVAEVERVVLWGLCDGASAALLYLDERPDPRVAGVVLLNPWVRSDASLAKTHVKHYYRKRLGERAFWLKVLNGKVASGAALGLLRNLRAAISQPPRETGAAVSYQKRMARAWASFRGERLLLLSQNDLTAREFLEHIATDPSWLIALGARPATRVEVVGADHTCSQPGTGEAVARAMLQWLTTLC